MDPAGREPGPGGHREAGSWATGAGGPGPRPAGLAAYLAASAGMGVLGAGVATAAGVPPLPIWGGMALAWCVQAAAFAALWGPLRRGERVTRRWAAGMAGRAGGLGVVALAGWILDVPVVEGAVAYVGTLLVLLWLEAAWLVRAGPGSAGPRSAGNGRVDTKR